MRRVPAEHDQTSPESSIEQLVAFVDNLGPSSLQGDPQGLITAKIVAHYGSEHARPHAEAYITEQTHEAAHVYLAATESVLAHMRKGQAVQKRDIRDQKRFAYTHCLDAVDSDTADAYTRQEATLLIRNADILTRPPLKGSEREEEYEAAQQDILLGTSHRLARYCRDSETIRSFLGSGLFSAGIGDANANELALRQQLTAVELETGMVDEGNFRRLIDLIVKEVSLHGSNPYHKFENDAAIELILSVDPNAVQEIVTRVPPALPAIYLLAYMSFARTNPSARTPSQQVLFERIAATSRTSLLLNHWILAHDLKAHGSIELERVDSLAGLYHGTVANREQEQQKLAFSDDLFDGRLLVIRRFICFHASDRAVIELNDYRDIELPAVRRLAAAGQVEQAKELCYFINKDIEDITPDLHRDKERVHRLFAVYALSGDEQALQEAQGLLHRRAADFAAQSRHRPHQLALHQFEAALNQSNAALEAEARATIEATMTGEDRHLAEAAYVDLVQFYLHRNDIDTAAALATQLYAIAPEEYRKRCGLSPEGNAEFWHIHHSQKRQVIATVAEAYMAADERAKAADLVSRYLFADEPPHSYELPHAAVYIATGKKSGYGRLEAYRVELGVGI